MIRTQFVESLLRLPVSCTRIKICGITRPEDAVTAAAAGADAIGLVFYEPSPRAVTPVQAASIAAALPPLVTAVALFVNAPAAYITSVLAQVPVDVLQFHGDESADFCEQFQRPYLKVLRVRPGMDLPALAQPFHRARGLLLDSWQQGVPGGTGTRFDWHLARADLPLPLVLAGGLDEHNVGTAISALRPAAVDVSGGVEQAPGIKDAGKIARFIAAVRAADHELNGEADDN